MKTTEIKSLRNIQAAMSAARGKIERQFAALRAQQAHVLELALNEAEALAWETGFPQLVFPTLAMEKVSAVATWHSRQKSICRNEPALAFVA
jgi:hypothetical protein